MKITIDIPPRIARDVIAAAVESGVYGAFWLRGYDARVRADGNGLYIGKPIEGGDACRDTPQHAPYVGAKRIAQALGKMLMEDNRRHPEIAARVICGNGDASDADIVLQYAAYGEVVWN